MRLSLVILTIVGFAAASPLTGQAVLTATNASARSDLIEDLVVAIVDALRSAIVNGNALTPVLDPYEKDYYYIDGAIIGQPESHLEVQDVYATGLGAFELEEINVELTSVLLQWYSVDLSILFDFLDMKAGTYNIRMIIFETLIWGAGDASLTVTNLRFKGNMNIGVSLNDGIYLHVRDCRIGAKLEDLNPVITGIYDSDVSSQYISEWIRSTVLIVQDSAEDLITFYLSSFLTSACNRILENLNVATLLEASVMEAARS